MYSSPWSNTEGYSRGYGGGAFPEKLGVEGCVFERRACSRGDGVGGVAVINGVLGAI